MALFSWFRSIFEHPHFSRESATRQLRIENLEERSLLSATSLFTQDITTHSAEFTLEPTAPTEPIVRGPESIKQALTSDAGDFYWHFNEQIPLLRRNDQIVVSLSPEADRTSALDALTRDSGLSFDETFGSLSSRTLILSRELGEATARDAFSELKDFVLSVPGVAWAAPVLVGAESLAKVYLTDEVGVALKPGVDPEEFFADGFGTWYRFFDNQYIATLETGGGLSTLEVANQLSSDERVEWATPNFNSDYRVSFIPDDDLFANQWNLNNTGQTGALSDADADLPAAWDITTGGNEIVIAVLDNGVRAIAL